MTYFISCTLLLTLAISSVVSAQVPTQKPVVCIPINTEVDGDTFITLLSDEKVLIRTFGQLVQSDIGRFACVSIDTIDKGSNISAIVSITNSSGVKRVRQVTLGSESILRGSEDERNLNSLFMKSTSKRDNLLREVGTLRSDVALIGGVDRIRTVERDIKDARRYITQLDEQIATLKKSTSQANKISDNDIAAAQEAQLSKNVSDLTRLVHEARSKKSPNYTVKEYLNVYNTTSTSDIYSLRERAYRLKQRLEKIRG